MMESSPRKVPMPPQLSDKQRTEGYLRSLALRQKRAELKQELKRGDVTLFHAWQLPCCAGMKVIDLIQALPGVGRKKAEKFCDQARISHHTTVQRCGHKQTSTLFQVLGKRCPPEVA